MFALSVLVCPLRPRCARPPLPKGEARDGVTDSHASDIGHWLGMTEKKQGAGAVDDCRGGRRCPSLRNYKKKNHSEGVVFFL